jgi:hypothetical protein
LQIRCAIVLRLFSSKIQNKPGLIIFSTAKFGNHYETKFFKTKKIREHMKHHFVTALLFTNMDDKQTQENKFGSNETCKAYIIKPNGESISSFSYNNSEEEICAIMEESMAYFHKQ